MATYRGHRVEDLLPTLLLFALFITNSILVTCQLPPETAEAIARTINATGNYATVNNKAQNGPIPLSDFRRCSESPLLGVGPEASGAVWVPTTGTLWVLGGGQAPALYEFSPPPELKPLRSIPLVPQIVDPEGVTWIGGLQLAVVNEEPPALWQVDTTTGAQRLLAALPDFPMETGSGLEGIAMLMGTNDFLVVQEKKPRRVLAVDVAEGIWAELYNMESRWDNTHPRMKDLSDMSLSPDGKTLYLLSQESKRVVQLSWPEGQYLGYVMMSGARPEGLTFSPDGTVMVVVSEGDDSTQPSTIAVYSSGPC